MKLKKSKAEQKSTRSKAVLKVASNEELTAVNKEIVSLGEQRAIEKDYTAAIITAIPQPLLVLDENFRIKIANIAFYQQFKVRPEDTLEKKVFEVGNGQWNIPALRKFLKTIIPQKESFSGFEVEHHFQSIGTRVMQLNARELVREKGEKLILLFIEDITERTQVEKSRSILTSVVDSSDDAIISKTLQGIITSWNKGAERIFGYNSEEVIGKHITLLIPPALQQEEEMVIGKIKKGEQVLHFETLRVAKDGRSINISLTVSPVKNKEGKIIGASKIARDITEHVNTRKKIEESEEKYRQLTDALPVLVWQTDTQGNQTFASKRWQEFTGLDPENAETFEKMVHPDDLAGIIKAWTNSLATGATYLHEVRLKSKEGEYHWFQVHGEPIYNHAKEIEKWVGAFTDITERKEAEEGIKESEEKFSTLADNMETLAWIADGEGWIYWYNKRWLDYTGLTLEEMQGWGWQKVHHPNHVERIVEIVKKNWHINETFELTFPLRRHDGEYRWFLTRGRPIADANGKVIRWLGTNTDITEQLQIAEDLKETKEQLEITFRNVPAAIYHFDKNGKILYLNEKGATQMGYTSVEEVLAEKDIFQFRKKLDELYLVLDQSGKPLPVEQSSAAITFRTLQPSEIVAEMVNRVTGDSFWLLSKSSPLFNEAGELSLVLTTSTDITFQKKSEQTLRYRQALLEAHNEASFDGILLVDAKGKIISYNHKFIEIWNMPQHIADAKDDEAALSFAMKQLVNPGQFIEKVKWLYEHPTETSTDILEFTDGKIVERHGYPVVADDGSYYAWSWTFRDITEQKQAEILLKESENLYHNLIYSSPSAIGVLKGEELVITTANDAIIEIWGKGKEIMGKKYFDALPELAEQGYREVFAEVYKTGNPFNAVETPVRIFQNGEMTMKYYNFLLYAQQNINNETDGIGIIATEVTTQAILNKQIQESEKRFRLLADSMPQHVWTADVQGNLNYFNQSVFDYSS